MLTDAEFARLERNSDGDVIDLANISYRLRQSQIDRLTGDDQSRCWDYKEEMNCLIAEARIEFGFSA